MGSFLFLPGFLWTLVSTLWCPAQHIDVPSKASTKKGSDECLPPDTTASTVGDWSLPPISFWCLPKDRVYPPCDLKVIYGLYPCVTRLFLSFIEDVWLFKHAAGWHVPRRNNGPILMEMDNKSIDMECSYLVVGCAAVLRRAEPISPSNGVYQPLCTQISNPSTKKNNNSKIPVRNEHNLVFYLFTLSACVRAHPGSWLLVVRTLASSVAQIVERLLLQWLLVQSQAPHACPWSKCWSMSELLKQDNEGLWELPQQHSLLHCPCSRKEEMKPGTRCFQTRMSWNLLWYKSESLLESQAPG